MRSIDELKAAFLARFGRAARVTQAPGRVNLIGEHTDYNDGFVLPFALEWVTRVAFASRDDRRIHVYAEEFGELRSFSLDDAPPAPRHEWLDYVEGMARQLEMNGIELRGADLWIEGDVPLGAGLSSSAALELSSGLAFLATVNRRLPPAELAQIGQSAEHRFVGTQCGIMDQLVSELGEADHALLIDCRSLAVQKVPLRLGNAVCMVCDTQVKHALAGSEYNQRRRECEAGVAILRKERPEVRALRDVTGPEVEAARSKWGEVVWKRCRHVVSENARTLQAAEALAQGRLQEMGSLMVASHESLRDDYEVSCRELDVAVAAAARVHGVYGSRMTGGGFGGSTVSLVDEGALDAFEAVIREAFAREGWKPPVFRKAKASDGAREI